MVKYCTHCLLNFITIPCLFKVKSFKSVSYGITDVNNRVGFCAMTMDRTVHKGEWKWFKQEKGLPHRGFLPSPGGLPQSIASEEECAARWGEQKGKNGFNIPKNYVHYQAMKTRYEQVHQRKMGSSVPLYFALGWVAEEKHGAQNIDWATFATWKCNNHDGPFEELEDRAVRTAEEDRERLLQGILKTRGRPSRESRTKGNLGDSTVRDSDSEDHTTGVNSPIHVRYLFVGAKKV